MARLEKLNYSVDREEERQMVMKSLMMTRKNMMGRTHPRIRETISEISLKQGISACLYARRIFTQN